MNFIKQIIFKESWIPDSLKIKKSPFPGKTGKRAQRGGNEQSARTYYKSLLVNKIITHPEFVIFI